MRTWMHKLAVLALLLTYGCSEPLDETACTRNDDCEDGHACNSDGVCVSAAQLRITGKTLMDAFTGEAYSDLVTATGGIKDYTWLLSPVDSGETRLDWIEIVPDTGEIRNKPGEFPAELGSGLRITVTVRDMSNRGEGQEDSAGSVVDCHRCLGAADLAEEGLQMHEAMAPFALG